MSALVTAPSIGVPKGRTVFMAGGITDCRDWQADLAEMLKNVPVVLLNPRRENFPIGDPTAAPAQITWEHNMLRRADAIAFWFSHETIQPIALYELGAWTMTEKKLFVGADPRYARTLDVEWQTRLARPDLLPISTALDLLAEKIRFWALEAR